MNKNKIKQSFIYISRIIYNEQQEIEAHNGETIRLLPSEVKVTKIRKENKLGHIGLHGKETDIILGIHPNHFQELTMPGRIITYLHELTHLTHPHHKKTFWDTYTDNFIALIKNTPKIDIWATATHGTHTDPDQLIRQLFHIFDKDIHANKHKIRDTTANHIAKHARSQIRKKLLPPPDHITELTTQKNLEDALKQQKNTETR